MAYELQLTLCSLAIAGFLWLGSYPTGLVIALFTPIPMIWARVIGSVILLLFIIGNGTVKSAFTPYDK